MFGILVEFRLIELFFLYLVLVLVHLRDHCLVFGHYFDGRGQVDIEVGPLGIVIIEATTVLVRLWVVEGCPEIGVFVTLPHDGIVSSGSAFVGLQHLYVFMGAL